MTDMVIPPEAVEAGALDLYRQERNHEPWLVHSEGVRERYRASARELLEAALPHLRPLFETATELGRRIGRQEASEEIVVALSRLGDNAPTKAKQATFAIAERKAQQIGRRHS